MCEKGLRERNPKNKKEKENLGMNNKMKAYLEKDYSNNNHLKNFCCYWMKAGKGNGDECRRLNDLDCLYFDGDLRADTLMSAWTPVKWVADCLNRKYGMKFYKKAKNHDDPYHYLKLLADDRDAYLPPKHELVQLLNRFLELAEQRCNYILLPDRHMNVARYRTWINGKGTMWLFDEVPAMLYHVWQKESLGRYFLGGNGEVDEKKVEDWICREQLNMGFDGKVSADHVLPLISGLQPAEAKWLEDEKEIRKALVYMITFLEQRKRMIESKEA